MSNIFIGMDKWKLKRCRDKMVMDAIQRAFLHDDINARISYEMASIADMEYRISIYWELVELEYSLGLRDDD